MRIGVTAAQPQRRANTRALKHAMMQASSTAEPAS